MHEKIQKFSPIKKRILQFVDYLNISKREFYAKTGISRGTLDNNSGITEDILTKIFANYSEISPLWLITGEGSMLISEIFHQPDKISSESQKAAIDPAQNNTTDMISHHDADVSILTNKIEMLERIIASKDETIVALQERIASQRHFLDMLSAAHRDIVDSHEKILEENNKLLNTNNTILNSIASPDFVQSIILSLSMAKKNTTEKYTESTEIVPENIEEGGKNG